MLSDDGFLSKHRTPSRTGTPIATHPQMWLGLGFRVAAPCLMPSQAGNQSEWSVVRTKDCRPPFGGTAFHENHLKDT